MLTSSILIIVVSVTIVLPEQFTQYPQGYYPFEESPAKIPPKVRKPPYLQTQVNCPGKIMNWIICTNKLLQLCVLYNVNFVVFSIYEGSVEFDCVFSWKKHGLCSSVSYPRECPGVLETFHICLYQKNSPPSGRFSNI